MPGALFPPAQHFLEVHLPRADVFGRKPRVIAGALDAVPRVGAVGAEVGDAVPLREVARVRLGGRGELRIELQGFQALVAAILVDEVARLVGIERGFGVVAVGERACRSALEGAHRRLVVELGNALRSNRFRRVGSRIRAPRRRFATEGNALDSRCRPHRGGIG